MLLLILPSLICRRYLVLHYLCPPLFFLPALSPFRVLHLFSGWEKNKMTGISQVGYSSSVLTNSTTKWIYMPKISGRLFSENMRCWKYMEEVSSNAGLTPFPRYWLLQMSGRGLLHEVGFNEATLLVLCLFKCKTVSIKITCSFPNEREIQQIYSLVRLKKTKPNQTKKICVSFWSSAISSET